MVLCLVSQLQCHWFPPHCFWSLGYRKVIHHHSNNTPCQNRLTLIFRLVRALEYSKLAPAGTTSVHNMLEQAASDLVAAGRAEIFSPMYFVLARKPLDS